MNRKKEKLYSTGEFAAYFGVKKDTLLYYDKIKLFCPAGVHRNGYRYYTCLLYTSPEKGSFPHSAWRPKSMPGKV